MRISRIIILGVILYMVYQCSEMCDGVSKAPDESYANLTDAERDSIRQAKHIDNLSDGAANAAKNYMKETLKFPSEAKWPKWSKPLTEYQGDSIFLISSYVDAKNAFGVQGRINYTAKVQYMGNEILYYKNWLLWHLKTDE